MSSLFSHIFIPITILLIISEKLKIDKKKIIILSFFSIFPDIDIFLDHRALFHNIFIVAIPIIVFILNKEIREIAGIISFYLMSHLMLDTFDGGIFLLFPVYSKVFFIQTDIWFSYSGIMTTINYGINNNIIGKDPMISSENIAIMIILTISILLSVIYSRYRNR